MDFKKCSEVYGYKSIAEVEEEELKAKLSEHDEKIAKNMFDAGKITREDAVSFFGVSKETTNSWTR